MNMPLFWVGVFIVVMSAFVPRARGDWFSKVVLCLGVMILTLAFVPRAHAREVMEVPNVAVLTDERGTCPRNHAIAIFPDRVRGCWTIGEHDRITRIYRGGKLVAEYSSLQIDIYGRLL